MTKNVKAGVEDDDYDYGARTEGPGPSGPYPSQGLRRGPYPPYPNVGIPGGGIPDSILPGGGGGGTPSEDKGTPRGAHPDNTLPPDEGGVPDNSLPVGGGGNPVVPANPDNNIPGGPGRYPTPDARNDPRKTVRAQRGTDADQRGGPAPVGGARDVELPDPYYPDQAYAGDGRPGEAYLKQAALRNQPGRAPTRDDEQHLPDDQTMRSEEPGDEEKHRQKLEEKKRQQELDDKSQGRDEKPQSKK